jgi:Protein of unknown function (DUF3768)
MTEDPSDWVERVRLLNDAFRCSFIGGVVAVTKGVEALPRACRDALLAKVRAFDAFNEDNDPHGEHDFGVVDDGDARYLWKIDYYDQEIELMSPDPADPVVTTRVLTIMLADEY